MIKKIPEKDYTIKQRKWLKAYVKTGNAAEAAMQVYDCKNRDTAANIGYENVRKLDFSDLMEESGLTDSFLNACIMEGIVSPVKSDITGAVHPDYAVRHKYLDTALKTKKKLGNDDTSTLPPNVNITFTRGEDA